MLYSITLVHNDPISSDGPPMRDDEHFVADNDHEALMAVKRYIIKRLYGKGLQMTGAFFRRVEYLKIKNDGIIVQPNFIHLWIWRDDHAVNYITSIDREINKENHDV